MPKWADLPDKIKEAWIASVKKTVNTIYPAKIVVSDSKFIGEIPLRNDEPVTLTNVEKTPKGWMCETKMGGGTSRICQFDDKGVRATWSQITNENPPVEGEQIYVETMVGIQLMTVHCIDDTGCYVENDSHLGSLSIYDGEWRCPGVGNKRSIQRIKVDGELKGETPTEAKLTVETPKLHSISLVSKESVVDPNCFIKNDKKHG